ncbi:MAG: Gfo/Idh/MocA family protein [Planctomycetota bacterium]|jgi:predicted dehydrogenase
MPASIVKVGVVGCGDISGIYLKNMTQVFSVLDPVACSDLLMDRAEAAAQEFGLQKACTTEELLADSDIDIVVNLTPPLAHAEVALAAVEAGKSIYNEKPLAVTRDDGRRLLEAAAAQGVLVGGAPDTFMGAGLQTCRKLVDDGVIGEPVAAVAFMTCHGHEGWHPSPEFFYQLGGGPMFDMGPYYLTTLVSLIGPVRRVTGATSISFPERTIGSQPKCGQTIQVEVPTHVAGILEFECGAVGTIVTSFDVWAAQLPRIEVYGTEGSLSVPDPNGFGGPVRVWRPASEGWQEVDLTHGYAENSRGIGVADMACGLRSGRPRRASGELVFHVLDIMQALHEAPDTGRHVELESTCDRPTPLPQGLPEGELDP